MDTTIGKAVKDGKSTIDDAVHGVAKGIVSRGRHYAGEELYELIRQVIRPIADKALPAQNICHAGEVHVVTIEEYDPATNTVYEIHTLMKNGELLLTKDDKGDVMVTEYEEGLDYVLKIIADQYLFEPRRNKRKVNRPKPKPRKDRPEPKNKRPKRVPLFDPCVIEHYEQRADNYSYAAVVNDGTFPAPVEAKGIDGLRNIMDKEHAEKATEVLGSLEGNVRKIRVGSATAWIQRPRNRGRIEKMVLEHCRAIVNIDVIRDTVRALYSQYTPEELYSLFSLKRNNEGTVVTTAFIDDVGESVTDGKPRNLREIYKYLMDERDRIGDTHTGDAYITCFRAMALDDINSARRPSPDEADRDDDLEDVMEDDDLLDIDDTTFNLIEKLSLRWIAIAKAVKEVNSDKFVSKEIIPYLEAMESAEDINNRLYYMISELGKIVVDRDREDFQALDLNRRIDGLWIMGYMRKRKNEKLEYRTLKGARSRFCDGAKQVQERYEEYEAVLDPLFERLVEEGKFDSLRYGLDTQNGCTSVAHTMADNLGDAELSVFRRLGSGAPLSSAGYRRRVVRFYVAVKNDKYGEILEQRKQEIAD